jgi:excisionase family DNA binding protein
MTETTPRWLTVQEAASYARLSPSTVRRAIKRQRLKAFRVGSAIRLQRCDLDAWLRATPTLEFGT